MYDILIKGGTVIDGTGAAAMEADVAIQDGKIAAIGAIDPAQAHEVIDAAGKTVTPGFIEMHSHADQTLLAYPTMDSMLHQGITTFVGCMCGQSIAPVGRYWLANQAMRDIFDELTPKLYADMYADDYYALSEEVIPLIRRRCGFDVTWRTFHEWLDAVDAHGTSGNIVPVLGYSTIRMNAAGPDGDRPLTEAEKAQLKADIHEALDAGAFGMSVGLDYEPGIFSDTAELLEMSKELKKDGGTLFAHWRKTGQRRGTPKRQKKIDGIKEILEIGLANDIQVQISHLSKGYDLYPANDDYLQVAASRRTLQVIDEYVARGVRAGFDVIPNSTGGTMIAPDLVTLFRPWYKFTGGVSLFLRNLNGQDYRQMIREAIFSGSYYILNPKVQPEWEDEIRIILCAQRRYEGKTARQVGQMMGCDTLTALFELLLIDRRTQIFRAVHDANAESVKTFVGHPQATLGNDTFVFGATSTVAYDPESPGNKPNPNTYCGFIKFLTGLGGDDRVEMIRKLTGRPAELLHLKKRGTLAPGKQADVLVIDWEALKTNENVIDPTVYPDGIQHVLVNGVPVIRDGRHTGALPGGAIRRQDC
ncbi:MAG TPA: amidohydrolase family protein [Candidatus Fournierella merdavium]|nr:amidohydrolase family protein [Candidatus Fournierella merdavium]